MVTCEGNDSKVKSLISEKDMIWDMAFESEEAVRTFYSIYAMHNGFLYSCKQVLQVKM